jgi:hypothetical protein
VLLKVLLNALCLVFFDGAGVRLLFSDADLGKNFEDLSALHLEFSRQIIDSNLVLHCAPFPPYLPPPGPPTSAGFALGGWYLVMPS